MLINGGLSKKGSLSKQFVIVNKKKYFCRVNNSIIQA